MSRVRAVGRLDAMHDLRVAHQESAERVRNEMKRQPRERRRRGIKVELQVRDVEMLTALARLRIARTAEIAALCFPGVRKDTVASRLRVLFDAGYLDVTTADRTSPNLYSLGPRGRDVVREEGGQVWPVPRGGLAHHLAIVRTWVALAATRIGGVRVELARPDWELRAEFGDRGLPIVPDLFAVLMIQGVEVPFAVEVDLATEPLHVLRAKLRAYAEVLARPAGLFGWQDFGLGLALGDDRRQAEIKALIAREWDGWSLVWTLDEGPDRQLHGLIAELQCPLTDSPCGQGRRSAVSAGGAMPALDERGGLSEE
jgi:hypothetical protein